MNAEYLHWLCSVPIGATLAIIGLIGNIISIIIWFRLNRSKSRRNKSTALYFMTLAFCDSSLLVFFLLHDSLPSTVTSIKATYGFAVLYSWCFFPMFFFSLVCSIWMVVGVTVNRYIMIAFPTKVQKLYSNTRSKLGILGIIGFAFLVNLPHFFTFHVVEKDGGYYSLPTDYGSSQHSINYEFWAHCIVLVLVPWAVIAILNGLIIFNLRKQMKKFVTEKGS
jgi:7 transmembrane receptor (rhodopsin family).